MSAPLPAVLRALRASRTGDGWVSAAASLGAVCVLGLTLQISERTIQPGARTGLTCTLVLSMLAVLAAGLGAWRARAEQLLGAGVVVALVLQLRCWFSAEPGQHLLTSGPWPYASMHLGLSVQVLAAGLLLGSSRRARPWLIALLLVGYVPTGLWVIEATHEPNFDVWIFSRDAARALLAGLRPYAIDIPEIGGTTAFYGEGLVRDGRVMVGYPYPPLSLYLATLGYLFGDPRYAQLVCVALAAALMALNTRSLLAAGAAALFLLTPRALLVLHLGFTEPFVVFWFAATVFCAPRYPRALPYLLGCLLAIKQYMFFVVPLLPLLTPLRGRALGLFVLRASLVCGLLTLPLLLQDPEGFITSVVKFQFVQPFRPDSLSYLPWWVERGHALPPMWVPFALTGLVIALALWRAPRTPAGFAAAVGLAFCTFFAFNKQAFINYYYFVLGVLCVSLAATRVPAERSAPWSG